jgi:hypothetical protein
VDESQDNQIEKPAQDKLASIRSRFHSGISAFKATKDLGDEDIKFIAGDQWPDDIARARKADKRPVLTVNRCRQLALQVTNDQKQNRPSIKVHAVDDKADPETAKILQGVIRQIENESDAEQAYDTGFENAVRRSYGYWRILTEYESPTSFKLKASIKRIRNPNSVVLGPHKEKDGRDLNWGFIADKITHDEFKSEFPNSKLATSSDFNVYISEADEWIDEEYCIVAEYFEKEWQDDELILFTDGEAYLKSKLETLFPKLAAAGITPVVPAKTRKTKIPVIKWYKTNGVEILEENIFPGQYIPIIPTYGDEFDFDGKVVYESVVRHAKDPNRIYNYMKSTEAETITLAPKSPFIAAAGQITPKNSAQWRNANVKNHAYLEYEPVTHEGHLVPPPQRQVFEPAVQAVTQAAQLAAEDIKYTSGVTDAAMGNRSNEISGIATQNRARLAQTTNFHFTDNQNLSIKHTGRILVDIIPIIYDTPQVIRILGEDGQGEMIAINQMFKYKGVERMFDFSRGKYDVVCETGPGYAVKRQETQQALLEMSKTVPQLMQAAPDLVIRSFDFANASEIADRLKKTIDPNIIDDPNKPPVPPEIQAQMMKLDQIAQQFAAENAELKEIANTKKMETESRERIEVMKLETQIALKELEIKAKALDSTYKAELDSIKLMLTKRLGLLDFNEPINDDFEDQQSPDQAQDFQMNQPNDQQQFTGELPPGTPME